MKVVFSCTPRYILQGLLQWGAGLTKKVFDGAENRVNDILSPSPTRGGGTVFSQPRGGEGMRHKKTPAGKCQQELLSEY